MRSRITLYHLLFLTLAIVVCYERVLGFGFLIGWDDQWFVTNKYTESGFQISNLKAIFGDFYFGQYAPLNQLYYTGIYYFFGYDTAAYHALSVFIHIVNAILVYFLAKKIAPRILKIDERECLQIGFLTALLFSIMPVNVEAVAWVAASKVELYALFYLLAIHYYLRYLDHNHSKWYYLCMACFFLSFAAKEQAVVLPLCLLLIDYIFRKDLRSWSLWLEKLPFFVLSILFGLITLQSQALEFDRNIGFYSWGERLILSLFTLMEYIAKTIIPVNLSYLYPFPFEVGEVMPTWLWLYALGVPLITVLLYPWFNRILRFGLLFFLIHIVLVMNIISLARFSIIADRYTYLASFGLCLIIACFFVTVCRRSQWRKMYIVMIVVYLLGLGSYTFYRIDTWKNADSLKFELRKQIKNRPDYLELIK